GMVFELACDFTAAVNILEFGRPKQHIVRLLEEAIRRDIHFIARHPTTLFQCLWNTCWWYDCPQAVQHYDNGVEQLPLADGMSATSPRSSGDKLSMQLEEWRTQKERALSGFLWLRSFR